MGINLTKIPDVLVNKTILELKLRDSSIGSMIDYLLVIAGDKNKDVEFCPLGIRKIKSYSGGIKKFPKSIISDVMGPFNLQIDNPTLVCSFLAGREPKIYFLPYFLFAEGIEAKLTVWIDDVVARLKYQRNYGEQSKINLIYKKVLRRFNLSIIFSSEYFSNLIIPDWIINNVSKLNWPDLFELFPYSRRQLAFVKVFDIIHYFWFATIMARCNQDYFLTSINNLGASKLLTKTLCVKRNFIFLPKAPVETGDPHIYTLLKPNKSFDDLDNKMIDYLFEFYRLISSKNLNLKNAQKIKLLKKYAKRGSI